MIASFLLLLCVTGTSAMGYDDPEPSLVWAASAAPTQDPSSSRTSGFLSGAWLEAEDPAWAPLRGRRYELSLFWGGQAALLGLVPDQLPTVAGTTVDVVGRLYPVDRLAVTVGARGYFGLDGAPAPGTTAATVVSVVGGLRYDLVRENRFSLMLDLFSGPSVYMFNTFSTADVDTAGAGGEMGTAVAFRYSVTSFTAELRGVAGGRAGATSRVLPRSQDSGPFSATYVGVDVGGTWSTR